MKNAKTFSRIASIAFILTFLLTISQVFIGYGYNYYFNSILWLGILISMAILLLTNKLNIGFPIITGINALRYLYCTRSYWKNFSHHFTTNTIIGLCCILSNVTLFVLFLISMMKTAKARKMINALWFIPGAILLVECLFVCWGTYNSYSDGYRYNKDLIYIIIQPATEFLGFLAHFFTCLWINAICREDSEDAPASLSNSIYESVPTLGDADKLLQYKELLDSGIITQEEFDEKKKQVLGL